VVFDQRTCRLSHLCKNCPKQYQSFIPSLSGNPGEEDVRAQQGVSISRCFPVVTPTAVYQFHHSVSRGSENSFQDLGKSLRSCIRTYKSRRLHASFICLVQMTFRAMGAKVGKRVYWPGSGIYCPDPELLEIGHDVVFGSRSEFLTTDGIGTGKIVIGDGGKLQRVCPMSCLITVL